MSILIRARIWVGLALCLALSACISPRSFVDPAVPKLAYEDLVHPAKPLQLELAVEFRRNGTHLPKADSTLRDDTERILRASGVILPVTNGGEGRITVTMNNLGNLGAAAAKGFGTGLTFGMVGSTVRDAYELSVTISVGSKTFTSSTVRDSLYTMIGNTSAPAGVETVPPIVAFQRVLEQMLLRALKEYQSSDAGKAARPPVTASGQ